MGSITGCTFQIMSGPVTILQEPAAKRQRGLVIESNGEDLHASVNMFVRLFERELSVKSLRAVPLAQL